MKFDMPVQIAVDDVNGTVISTIDLKSMGRGIYETCVFFPNGNSEVIHRTRSKDAAEIFHQMQVAFRSQ